MATAWSVGAKLAPNGGMLPRAMTRDVSTSAPPAVVVLGGGVSRALTAWHLARAGQSSVVVEPRASIGPGLAHAAASAACCLNVVAGTMSALHLEMMGYLHIKPKATAQAESTSD